MVSVAVMAVMGEWALRSYFLRHQSYLVEMWRYGRNHKQFVPDKRSHVHRPGTKSLVMGHAVEIDKWGYRGPERDPDPHQHRTLVLGDSMTFGFGVAQQEAYPALLEKALNGTQVWNSGVGNYNTEQELATLPFHLPRLHPDEVILGFFINDLEPTQRGSESALLQSSLLFTLASQVWSSYGDDTRKDFKDYYLHWFDTGWSKWAEVTQEGIRSLEDRGIPLRVLLIPELHTLKKETFSAQYRKVADFFRARGVPVCDGAAFFPDSDTGGTQYWAAPDDSHANAEAHRLLAKGLLTCFYEKNGMYPADIGLLR